MYDYYQSLADRLIAIHCCTNRLTKTARLLAERLIAAEKCSTSRLLATDVSSNTSRPVAEQLTLYYIHEAHTSLTASQSNLLLYLFP